MDTRMALLNQHAPRPGTIVRRFTDSLDGSSALSVGTKIAPLHIEAEIEARERIRTRQLYYEVNSTTEPFDETDEICKGLSKAADEFFKSMESKKKDAWYSISRKSRRNAKVEVERHVRQSQPKTLNDVKELVADISEEWQNSHGAVYRNFHRMCQSLDAHDGLLKIVPRENTYVAVISGALSVVVEASVYHDEIAEDLSRTTTNLLERAAECSRYLEVIRDRSMLQQLGEVYRHLFLFILNAIEWFKKPSTYRFWDSFNKEVKKRHDLAEEAITTSINIFKERAGVSHMARTEDTRLTAKIIESKVDYLGDGLGQELTSLHDKIDHVWQQQNNILRAGENMFTMFRGQFDEYIQEVIDQRILNQERVKRLSGSSTNERYVIEGAQGGQSPLTRAGAKDQCTRLSAFVYGTDGIELAKASPPMSADVIVIAGVGKWIKQGTRQSEKLWIEFPFEMQEETVAKAAALSVVNVAAKAGAPFISYVCKRPNPADIGRGQTPEGAGVLSMAYSLVMQLLQFQVEEDECSLDPSLLDSLDESAESLNGALELLSMLLKQTPVVRYCIVHGLSAIENGPGAVPCKEVVDVLVSHTKQSTTPFSVLFTTSGQSRVLARAIGAAERIRTDASTRAAQQGRDNRPNAWNI